MYIPRENLEKNTDTLLSFMREYSFATLVTSGNGRPEATHLPFVIEERDEKIFLTTHMARANKQWKEFGGNEVLVIFQEPHAYISPGFYEHRQNVPTWNYTAVHAYGVPVILKGKAAAYALLEKMIRNYEEAFMQQWEELSEQYKSGLAKGIVAFEIEVTELQGKQKLSQNKTVQERQNIIGAFEKSEDPQAVRIAGMMKKYPYRNK